ncbi:MAG: formate/nitrite transporter family protein [Porphyromonas sp.]|nr:formate/nitrite transporter family protein [Porphyromonas sp.]
MNTPNEVHALVSTMGVKKYHTPLPRLILLGLLAGIYIAMGGLLSTLASAGMSGLGAENPILPRLLAGATFPLGLMLVVLVGAELFTGNTAYLMPATFRGDIPPTYFLRNWFVVYFANFAGALLFDYFIVYQTGVLMPDEFKAYILRVAEAKVSQPWWQVFWRGVGANWLVCLAVWLGLSSRTMLGRLVGIWWPVMAFVVMGFEHSIANMFYLPSAMLYGSEVGWTAFLIDNLVPATLGNIVGGALLVGCAYAYIYGAPKNQ